MIIAFFPASHLSSSHVACNMLSKRKRVLVFLRASYSKGVERVEKSLVSC